MPPKIHIVRAGRVPLGAVPLLAVAVLALLPVALALALGALAFGSGVLLLSGRKSLPPLRKGGAAKGGTEVLDAEYEVRNESK